ncbi:MAG TPA: polyprenyl diphosphate synthase [Patescibacteria group bacterium]|nr:polyprenyl diphosphate synthase [Patescibacteria group bacterium]
MQKELTIQPDRLPHHVVIIPDGNRRWATERNLAVWEGHAAGANNTEKLVQEAQRLGVKEISFWGSSLDNLSKRPLAEKQALLNIYETYFKKLITSEDIHKNQVHIRCIGRWEKQFPPTLCALLRAGMETTKQYDKYFLNFFLAYSGDDEMRQAFEDVAKSLPVGKKMTDAIIKEHLMTRDMPPVDLLIRTGGEPHLSAGFMMWDIANAQLYFSPKYYPDFDEAAFREAIADYAIRGRRFGK